MTKIRKILFYISNAILGIITFYIYLYFWVTFSYEEVILQPLEFILTFIIGLILYFIINYFLLRNIKDNKRYWLIGFSELVVTILIIIFILSF